MPQPLPAIAALPPPPSVPEMPAAARVALLAARVARTLGVARVLAASGRQLDLSGIEDGVGALCAQTLDLPAPEARCMLPVLHEVLDQLNKLSAVLAEARAAPEAGARVPPAQG